MKTFATLLLSTTFLLPLPASASDNDTVICTELSNLVLAGHIFAEAKYPFWKVHTKVQQQGGSADYKATKLRMITTGYKAYENGMSQAETYNVAFEACMKPVPKETPNEFAL